MCGPGVIPPPEQPHPQPRTTGHMGHAAEPALTQPGDTHCPETSLSDFETLSE